MRQVRQIMGMPITIDIPAAKSEKPFAAVFKRLAEIDRRFSTYKEDSEVSRYDRGELAENQLSTELKQVIKECKRFERETDGWFSAWYGVSTASQKAASAAGSAGRQGEAVRGRGFDPSGFVKGWAIAEAGKIIAGQGFGTYCVSAGGDILCRSNSDKIWHIGIQDPTDKSKILNKSSISNGAVATSGSYERGAHIFNPKTGQSADYFLSVSVIGPDIVRADVLATVIYAMGQPGLDFIKSQTGYQALTVAGEVVGDDLARTDPKPG